MSRGFFGIGVQNIKTGTNYGTLFRTANILGAAFIFTIGRRFVPQCSDTLKSHRHLPTFTYEDFHDFARHRPFDAPLIGVELVEEAMPLGQFNHPDRAVYLLGAEDHGLSKEALKGCDSLVKLPGASSFNVAVAGSIVLYDRAVRGKGGAG